VWAPVAAAPSKEIESTARITEIDFDDDSLPPLVEAPPHYDHTVPPPAPSQFILFPPAEDKGPTKRSSPHSKKKPENHIPRPPNAFILFRSSFIKAQHVSQDVETNHSTLSKIIGITWKNLPESERQTWHEQAKKAQEQHRRKFPQYAFRPQQTKGKGGTAAKRKVREVEPKDMKRCAKIAELLGQGLKGSELDAAIAEFDKTHVPEIVTRFEAPITEKAFRRSSSAPIPDTELTIEQQSFLPKEKPAAPRKQRSVSARPTRCSTPQTPQHATAQMQPVKEQASFNVSSPRCSLPTNLRLTQQASPQDFSSFSFENIASPITNYACDPLVDSFAAQPTQEFPAAALSIDTSFMSESDWSQCSSPVSPAATSDYLSTPSPSPTFASTPVESFGNTFEKSFTNYQYPVYEQQTLDASYTDSFLVGANYNDFSGVDTLATFNMDAFTFAPQTAATPYVY